MKIFDAHVHVDPKDPSSILSYINEERIAGINLILNTEIEKDIFFQYANELRKSEKKITLTVTQDYRKDNFEFVKKLKETGFEEYALKLHPRIEKYSKEDIQGIVKYVAENDFKFIVVDAFYYGHELMYQISKELIIELAIAFPEKKIIIAHSGGYRVLEYTLTMRSLPNVFFDLSYMNYFELSSVMKDFKQLIAYNSKRIFFGTDFPDFSLEDTLNIFENLIAELPNRDAILENILFENYRFSFL